MFIFISLTNLKGQDETGQTLQLHTTPDTGITSCDLEAGNGFDLAELDVDQPFVVDAVRFYAQSFPGRKDGPVTVSLYEDNRGCYAF